MTEGYSRVARSLRARWVENIHFGVAAVATPDGKVVAHLGDPGCGVFLRSAAKPIQLLPLLLAGGQQRFGLSDAEMALMCSSHAGTDEHVQAVQALLDRLDLSKESLTCGTHLPLDRKVAAVLRDRGERPGTLHNNCSGNHVGQLLACRILGLPIEGYRESDHPLQERVLNLIAEFAGVEPEAIQIGVDGCGLPSFRMAAERAARLYACLADPEAGALAPDLVRPTKVITEAMAAHPEMVAGPGRFTTALIRATGGRVIGKEGAEGFYGVMVRGPVALGAVIKIVDGSEECRDGVVIEVLRQAGCLSRAEFDQLSPFYRKELRNHSDEVIGDLAPDLELVDAVGHTLESTPGASVAGSSARCSAESSD